MRSLILAAVLGYILGALPWAFLAERLCRGGGSRHAGWMAGSAVLLDAAKGVAAVLLAQRLFGSQLASLSAGLAAVLGSDLLSLLGVRGSKGLATVAGVLVAISPPAFAAAGFIWLASALAWRYAALSSSLSFAAMPILLWRLAGSDAAVLFGIVLAAIGLYRYLDGLERIREGREPRLGDGQVPLPPLDGCPDGERLRLNMRRAAALFLVFAALGVWYGNRYVYRGFGLQVDIIRRGPPDLPVVALTFDDGPDPAYTPQILDILREKDVRATFFMVGRHVEAYPEIARRIVAEGHDIGNHTYTHRSLVPLGPERTGYEIERAEEAITAVTGGRSYLLRPPRGLYSASAMEESRKGQYTMVLWSLSPRDWAGATATDIVRSVLAHTKNGEIILLHDSGSLISASGGDRRNTVKALPEIIDGLRARGYEFVTMNEMIIYYDLFTQKR